jgi:hypothetical protein
MEVFDAFKDDLFKKLFKEADAFLALTNPRAVISASSTNGEQVRSARSATQGEGRKVKEEKERERKRREEKRREEKRRAGIPTAFQLWNSTKQRISLSRRFTCTS